MNNMNIPLLQLHLEAAGVNKNAFATHGAFEFRSKLTRRLTQVHFCDSDSESYSYLAEMLAHHMFPANVVGYAQELSEAYAEEEADELAEA